MSEASRDLHPESAAPEYAPADPDMPEGIESAPRDEYTHGHHESVLRTHSWRTVENSAAYLIPELKPGLTLLDVGSGPGTITIDLARRLAPGEVIGIDAAATIVEQSQALANDEGVDNVRFQVGDVYALDFPDDTFDIVHAHQVLQHVANPVAAMREIYRVLKPGGLFAARDVDYGGVVWYPVSEGLAEWMRVYRDVHFYNGGTPDAGRALKAWAHLAGFAGVRSSASIWCFASELEREWWGESWAVRATESTSRRTRSKPASRISVTCAQWRTPGGPGCRTPTPGSRCRTARSWHARSTRSSSRRSLDRPDGQIQSSSSALSTAGWVIVALSSPAL